jgi:hypothetical protein
VNRGIYGLSTQAVNGLGVLQPPGQSVGLYARVIPWLSGFPNVEGTQSIAFLPRPYVVIGTDPTIVSNNGNSQFTGLALQLPNVSSAFITIPALTDTNYASQNFGTSVGGARGQGAVDVQTYRTTSSQVASGQFATAVGQANTASGQLAAAVGYTNTASGSSACAFGYANTSSSVSTVALGISNSASSTNAVAIGQSNNVSSASVGMGISNTVAGSNATGVGHSNTASGSQSLAIGFSNNTNSLTFASAIGVYASSTFAYSLSLSANRFSTSGDSQLIFARQSFQTTTATATQLFGDNTSATSRLTVAASTSYAYKLQLVARQTGGAAGTAGDTAVWNIEGGVYRAAAGSAILLGATTTSYSAVTAAAAWTATVSVDTVNNALVVTVAGEASKNINWVAFWQLVRSA